MSSSNSFFVTCPKGLESLLAAELAQLGGAGIRESVSGVKVEGPLALAYRACLWSRLGNKILLAMGQCAADSAEALYKGVSGFDWAAHLRSDGKLWIDLSGTTSRLRNTQHSAQVVKDAIVDQLRTSSGIRPSICRDQPDLILNVRLHRGKAAINIDLCGDSLHKRGYRQRSVTAPLKENLAAALLMRSGWLEVAADGGHLIDPMCGSGTLLTEAAMMLADVAPGLARPQFAFERWTQHQDNIWAELKREAEERKADGMARSYPEIRGYDADPSAVAASRANAEVGGLDSMIRLIHKPLEDLKRPTHGDFTKGLLITNPPYGERLGERDTLLPLYGQLGDMLKRDFGGWRAAVFTGNPELGRALGLRSHKRYKLLNGPIASELLLFDVFSSAGRKPQSSDEPTGLSAGAQMVANRLQKNLRSLRPWAEQRGTNCYRVYDADLPEYAAAIDYYAGKLHIQEYQAPASVNERKAEQRLRALVDAACSVFDLDKAACSLKQRRRNRGKDQYQPQHDKCDKDFDIVREGRAQFAVNLWTYLDTGIFLDHRIVREKVASLAFGKRLLNLFCYTASVTVHAAIAGARSSVSVDMSRTYLDWASKNFELNNIGKQHQLVQADCLQWLQQCREGFDVIVLDPPSFSNSKRMEGVLDVQRDHISLIKRCLDILNPNGYLIFSTNLRRFRFDYDALPRTKVEDISTATIDKDFQRNPKIHQCFLITHE